MDDPNITMKEYIRLEEEKAQKHVKMFNWETAKYGKIWYDEDIHDLRSVETEFLAIAFNDGVSSEKTLSCKPTISPLNDNKIDFRISFDESDDEDYTVIYDKNSFSYKAISVNNLKTDSKNDNDKVSTPSFPSPEPMSLFSSTVDTTYLLNEYNAFDTDKFEGHNFKQWPKKMHLLLMTLKVVYVLTTPMPELLEDSKMEAIRIRVKWENDDYIGREHILNGMSDFLFDVYINVELGKELWDSLESKYMVKDASTPYTPQKNGVAERKNRALKEMGCSAVVNLPDPKRKTLGEKGIDCIFVGYAEHSKAYRFYVIEPNESVSINSIIESRDVIFSENRFSSIPRPKDIIPNSVESQGDDNSDDVPSETPEPRKGKRVRKAKSYGSDFQLYLVEGLRNQVGSQYSYCYSIEEDLRTYNEAISDKGVIICLYIDDMLIFGIDQYQVDKTKKFLSSRFSMKDMGEADVILGIKIKRENKRIVITQYHYIKKILKKFNHENCSSVSTPMDPIEKLKQNTGKPVDQLKYSRAIGCLIYAMTSTRPDIAYAVGRLSRFTSNPSRQHWKAITRVFKYLKGTMNYGLSYFRYPSMLEGYSDASWINHVEDSSSTSGWVFLLGGGAISWASKKKTYITGSTIESEFAALSGADKEEKWLRNLIHEIPIWPKPIALISIYCDSITTLAKAYSQMYNGTSRHLGVRNSMIRKLIMNGVISIEFVRSQHNLADDLTKGLTRWLSFSILSRTIAFFQAFKEHMRNHRQNNKKDKTAIAFLFQALPEEQLFQITKYKTAKAIWDALKTRHIGEERVQQARLQTLKTDFEMLHMKEDETIDTFTGKLTTLVNKAASLWHTMEDETLVRKLLNDVSDRYLQIVTSIEQYSDLSEMTMEEAIGRLKTYEERIKHKRDKQVNSQESLMFTLHEGQRKPFREYGHGRFNQFRGREQDNNNYQSKRKNECLLKKIQETNLKSHVTDVTNLDTMPMNV
nr:zinc finger, CCHC-type [Tanacetum cinerariifolium]